MATGSVAGTISYQNEKDNLAKTHLAERVRMRALAMTQFRGLARPEPSFGANRGQAVAIEKWQKLNVDTSTVSEWANLPLKKPNINEITVTISEYGNGVSSTKKAKTISEYLLDEQLRRVLEMNVTETMDKVVGAEFQTSDVFWTPTGTASAPDGTIDKDGTVSTASTRDIQAFDFRQIRANLRKDNIPTFDGASYLAVMNPFGMNALFSDEQAAGMVEQRKYDQPESLIRGEIGSYFGFRFVEESLVLSDSLNTQTTHNGEVIVIADDAVVEAVAMPETILAQDTKDFGRFIDLAWHAYTGFEKIWSNAVDGEYRIVRIWAT